MGEKEDEEGDKIDGGCRGLSMNRMIDMGRDMEDGHLKSAKFPNKVTANSTSVYIKDLRWE